jgi:HK97 family phage major capsid protein
MFIVLKKDLLGQKAGARVEVDDGVGKQLVESGAAEALKDDPLAPLMAKAMEGLFGTLTRSLETSLDSAMKEFARAAARSRKNAIPAIFGEGGGGDPKKTFGRFLLAVRAKDHKTLEEMGSRFVEWDQPRQKTALTSQTGTLGGYLVPDDFYKRLMTLVTEMAVVRPRATVIPQSVKTTQIPVLDVTTVQSAGDTPYLGGLVARWTEEAASLNEAEPAFKMQDLSNYELSGYSKISNTLLSDEAIGLESFLMQLFSRAIAWYEDYAFLRGNGVGKPLGVQSWAGYVQVTRDTASHFKLNDVGNLYAKLLPGGSPNSVCWVIHPTVLADLINMTGGDQVLFMGNDAHGAPKMTLLGKDIAVTEKVPALGTANCVSLNDFSQYLIGDRQQVEIAFSEHVAFLNNQSVWRFVSRVGGMPWLRDKITLQDASSTLSPFVGLTQ